MNNGKISGFKRNHAGGDEKLVVNKINVGLTFDLDTPNIESEPTPNKQLNLNFP